MKRIHILAFALVLALALPATALANHLYGDDWDVTFTTDAKMVDTYSQQQWADDIRNLQPGDDITFTINLNHKHSTTCDWYMANEVLKTLEEGSQAGSAYGYYLVYTNPSGEDRVLYDSEHVGGDDTEGLLDATSGLEDYFYLDSLKKGQTAQVKLVVSLDGETEGNAYFDTIAQVKMKFAVELPTTPDRNKPRTVVQTGDEMNLFPFYVAMAVSGALLLLLAIGSVRRRKQEEGSR